MDQLLFVLTVTLLFEEHLGHLADSTWEHCSGSQGLTVWCVYVRVRACVSLTVWCVYVCACECWSNGVGS